MIDGAGDDAACDQRLAESDFVGYEETCGAVFCDEQAVECMLYRTTLKRFERLQELIDAGSIQDGFPSRSVSSTADQTANRSSGTIFRPSSVLRRSPISRRTGFRRSGSRAAARHQILKQRLSGKSFSPGGPPTAIAPAHRPTDHAVEPSQQRPQEAQKAIGSVDQDSEYLMQTVIGHSARGKPQGHANVVHPSDRTRKRKAAKAVSRVRGNVQLDGKSSGRA